jgi:uncharacterized membrane protein YgdD (TMEM256/DUF423 family)
MSNAAATRIAAAAGFLAVVLGALGAHGLKDVLTQNGTATIWEKAVFYHFIHAVMLLFWRAASSFPSWLGGVFLRASWSSPARFICWRLRI